MLSQECVRELQTSWLPHLTESGLDRLIELLDKGSPLLIHGCFTRSVSMGCLATHAAWHHPATEHLNVEAGISWLHGVAGLNPATSHVIREWDRHGARDWQRWQLRTELVAVLKAERRARQEKAPVREPQAELVEV